MGAFRAVQARVLAQLRQHFHAESAHHLAALTKAAGDPVPPTSLWVGFWLDARTALALALPFGEPPGALHVTLCYVPETTETQAAAAVEALRVRALAAGPFQGAVTGSGRFDGGHESGARDVLYAVPDLHGLSAFRQACVEALSAVGAVPSREHEFTPHIAVQYLPHGEAAAYDPPGVPLAFDALEIRRGGELLARLPLGPERPLAQAAREDEDPRVARLLAELDLSGFAVLADPLQELLEAVALSSGQQGLLTLRALVPDAEDFALPADAIAAWARERAAALVGKRVLADGTVIDNPDALYAIDEATREMLRGVLADAFEQGSTFAELEAAIRGLSGERAPFSEERAALIARTEVAGATVQGNLASWRASGVVTGKEWVLGDLHDLDDECDGNADQGPIAFEEDFASGDDAPPAHPRCLLGGTQIASTGAVTASYKRRYAGKIVRLRIENVPEVAATPNHPILTADGWRPAGELRQGDRLVYCPLNCAAILRAALAGREPDDQDVPAPIKEIAGALVVAGAVAAARVPVSAEAFHGDRSVDGQVDIVRPARLLKRDAKAGAAEVLAEDVLADAHEHRMAFASGGDFHPVAERLSLPADRGVRGSGSALALCGRGAGGLDAARLRGGSNLQPSASEDLAERRAMTAEAPRQIDRGFSRQVASVEAGDVSISETAPHEVDLSFSPNGQPGFAEDTLNDLLRDAGVPGDVREGLAPHVRLVELADVRQDDFVGHVYNLETEHGFYVAEGVLVHNCACDVLPVVGGEEG